eukprot:TRINITY_DN123629_c0_g1_i1.p1 TRINITY_DN123629_c0_g1~~TRINITY_DN123629_c0_g1_i1.p1  ORF type:complete len:853 (+),score=191.19 TRINITY_DN123629_c0_g1_i1:112-2670(+)
MAEQVLKTDKEVETCLPAASAGMPLTASIGVCRSEADLAAGVGEAQAESTAEPGVANHTPPMVERANAQYDETSGQQSAFCSRLGECPHCGQRPGVFFGLMGFGWRQKGHEERCLARVQRREQAAPPRPRRDNDAPRAPPVTTQASLVSAGSLRGVVAADTPEPATTPRDPASVLVSRGESLQSSRTPPAEGTPDKAAAALPSAAASSSTASPAAGSAAAPSLPSVQVAAPVGEQPTQTAESPALVAPSSAGEQLVAEPASCSGRPSILASGRPSGALPRRSMRPSSMRPEDAATITTEWYSAYGGSEVSAEPLDDAVDDAGSHPVDAPTVTDAAPAKALDTLPEVPEQPPRPIAILPADSPDASAVWETTRDSSVGRLFAVRAVEAVDAAQKSAAQEPLAAGPDQAADDLTTEEGRPSTLDTSDATECQGRHSLESGGGEAAQSQGRESTDVADLGVHSRPSLDSGVEAAAENDEPGAAVAQPLQLSIAEDAITPELDEAESEAERGNTPWWMQPSVGSWMARRPQPLVRRRPWAMQASVATWLQPSCLGDSFCSAADPCAQPAQSSTAPPRSEEADGSGSLGVTITTASQQDAVATAHSLQVPLPRTSEVSMQALTAEEEAKARLIFELCDVDGTQTITMHEFVTVCVKHAEVAAFIAMPWLQEEQLAAAGNKSKKNKKKRGAARLSVGPGLTSLFDEMGGGEREVNWEEFKEFVRKRRAAGLDGRQSTGSVTSGTSMGNSCMKPPLLSEDVETELIFEICDTDGNGTISLTELAAACIKYSKVGEFVGVIAPRQRADEAKSGAEKVTKRRSSADLLFAEMDVDDSKTVTKEEFRSFVRDRRAALQTSDA